MKTFVWLAAVCALAGCGSGAEYGQNKTQVDELLVRAHQDEGIRGAILAQHTLYPYHFVENSDQLNTLGRSDLEVLTEHFRHHPGPLNVRRGAESATLYKARLLAVIEAMKANDLTEQTIQVGNDLPGGDGMGSEEVIRILQRMEGPAEQGRSQPYTVTAPPAPAP